RVFPGVVERAEEAEGAEKLFFLNSLRLCVSAVEDLGARRLRAEAFIIEGVPPLTFAQARETVVATVRAARVAPGTEEADSEAAAGRVLAEDIAADRDVPATARSVRDGYAVRSIDLPGELEVMGEVRAVERF